MKRVLITGAAGLIGSHLVDRMLDNGYFVTGVDNLTVGRMSNIALARKNRNFKFLRIDVSKKDEISKNLKGERFDIVVHMAASKKISESGSSLKVLTNNVDSTLNMLELARKNKSTFIFASTSDVYGVSKDLPFREDGNVVLGPSYIKRWAYAVSKLYCEHLVFAYYQEYGLPVLVIRYFGCFSSRSNYGPSGGHVPMFIKQALNGKVLTIHGDGKQTRSMAYVGDAVEGTLLAIENKKALGNIINIGSDEEVSVRDAARMAIDAAKEVSDKSIRARVRYIPMKMVFGDYKEIERRVPSLIKARKILGFRPARGFKEAVRAVALEMSR